MGKARIINPIDSSRSELARLIETLTSLQTRDLAMTVEVGQAVATRRKLLIEDADSALIAEAERACREVEGTAHGIADALAEVERRIAEIENRIEVACVEAEREQVASHLERNAAEIQTATNDLAKAIDAVAKAHAMLGIAISGAAAGQFDPVNGIASPSSIARFILLQGFARVMPEIDIHAEVKPWSIYSLRALVEGDDPLTIASEFGQRLRETASGIRTREIDHSLIAGEDFVLPDPFSLEEVQIFVVTPFQYQRKANAREMVTSAITYVPHPVAERAIELGVAAVSETADWCKARKPDGGPLSAMTNSYTWADCVDIDFNLDAWLTEQRQAA